MVSTDEGSRIAVAAVTDALTTAFMVLGTGEIATLCDRSPGLEAWVLPESDAGAPADLLHFGGAHPGTSDRGDG
jgi:hypothetical protein